MPDTIFTKIINGEIPADIVYSDEHCIAFRDINPQAPVHVLVIPRREILNVGSAAEDDAGLLGHLLIACQKVAAQEGLLEGGFRIVANNGPDSGQTVDHLHFHVLGGRPMAWPPG